jgi:hypothetical protein
LTFSSFTLQRWAISQVLSSESYFAEQLHHLRAGFQVEIRCGPLHARRVAHGFARLYAEHDLVRAGVVAVEIVGVVGGDERNAGFPGEADYQREQALVLLHAVVLQFEEEVPAAEDVYVGVSEAAGFLVAIGEQGFVDVAAQAGRERDEALRVA